jgi:two-component system, LytTR family, sensor kinase
MKKSIVFFLNFGYWFVYLALIVLVLACLNVGNQVIFHPPFYNIKFIFFLFVFSVVPALIGFYCNYLWLFIRYLTKKRVALFLLLNIATSLFAGIIGAILLVLMFMYKIGPGISNDGLASAIPIIIIMAIISFLNGVIGLVLKGFITWYNDIKLKEDLAQKNFDMELALIKSKLDPHFLFNAINNIDVLIEKDAKKASLFLNKLSAIMRFMLYQSKATAISLAQELQYIEQYIALQQIRVANPNFVQLIIKGKIENINIYPMLFIPFIENAFKHNSNTKKDNAIDILFDVNAQQIKFTCTNDYSSMHKNDLEENGIGNELIKKRLALLYRNKHDIVISKTATTYQVIVHIYLHGKN